MPQATSLSRYHEPPPDNIAEAFQRLHAEYTGAKPSRYGRQRKGIPRQGAGADFHYRIESQYLAMIELARDLDRNDVLVGLMVDRAADNITQNGFRLNPLTGDDEANATLKERWREWSNDKRQVDVAGVHTFDSGARLMLRAQLVDGDSFALPRADGRMQFIEGHRIRTPRRTKRRVVNGVLLGPLRERIEYWITKDDVDPLGQVNLVSEIIAAPAYDDEGNPLVLQVFNPKRITQTRGVTALAPCFETVTMFGDIAFAKLVQSWAVSCFAVFHSWAPGSSPPKDKPKVGLVKEEPRGPGGELTSITGIAPGTEYFGSDGERIEGFSPNVPNESFFEHAKTLAQILALNLGLPLGMAMLDITESSFSASRQTFEQARLGFRRNQKLLYENAHTPTYLWKLRHWLRTDKALASIAKRLETRGLSIFRHEFIPPVWPYVEPFKQVRADELRLKSHMVSPRRLMGETGSDWADVTTEIVEDRSILIQKAMAEAKRLNVLDPTAEVSWREMLTPIVVADDDDDGSGPEKKNAEDEQSK